MPQSFLITGGAGFIGSHLVDALLARGDHVVALDSLSTGRLSNLDNAGRHPNFRFVQGSILDEMVVDELAHQCDVIVHLAAAVGVKLIVEQPLKSLTTNMRGSEIIVDAAHRYRRRLLLASTSEIYGKAAGPLTETSDRVLGAPTVARWAYSTAKTVDEVLAYAYHKERGLPTTVVRLFNTVGPRQSAAYGMVVPTLVGQAVRDEPLTVFGDGEQMRCFCHVHDVVDALLRLLGHEGSIGEVFNVGAQEQLSILELARRIIAAAGSRSEIVLIAYEDAYEDGFEDMRRGAPSTDKLTALTGWHPTLSLDEILAETVAEARAELHLPTMRQVT
jgi:nucleoside-diphosphate-sugar epimerase